MVRNLARLLAPLILAAVAVGLYLIVDSNIGSHASTTTHTRAAHHSGHHHRRARHHARASVYVVQAGDTLSDIARRTHVSVATLESLNPSVNPNALQTGQRLRLRR